MLLSQLLPSRRGALRRAVQLECAIQSPLWEGSAFYLATDLSPEGLWLSTNLALELGDQLIVSFRPPRWPDWAWPVTALAEVVRVSLPRRRGDRQPSGMGVRFSEIDPDASQQMAQLMRGLPPPLPRQLPPPPARDAELPTALVLDDGTCFELRAESELLTAGRPAQLGVSARPRASAPAARRRRARAALRSRVTFQRAASRRARAHRKPLLRLVG